MAGHRDPLRSLKRLAQICLESQRLYEFSAREIEDPGLRKFLTQFAEQRHRFLERLTQEIQDQGGQWTAPAEREYFKEFWPILADGGKADSRETSAILKECIRMEESVMAAYEAALADNKLSEKIREVVERQYAKICEARMQITAVEYKNNFFGAARRS